jgi:hypothetical protein
MIQTANIEKIIKTYNLKGPKIKNIPIQQKTYFTKKTTQKFDKKQKIKYVLYCKVIKSLFYVKTYTRPENTFFICALTCFVANLKYNH